MSKNIKTMLILLFFSVACWFIEFFFSPSNYELVLFVVSTILSLLFINFCSISIVEKMNKSISPYRVFAITDFCISSCIAIYAVYDIKTDTGWFSGIIGTVLLMFVVPIGIILLLADFIVWKLKDKQKPNK